MRFDFISEEPITLTEQLTVPSIANGLFIDASSLPNGLTLDADAEDGDNRRVMFDPTQRQRRYPWGDLHRWECRWRAIGGAIFAGGQGDGNSVSLSLSSCTISGNSALFGGGIFVATADFRGDALIDLHSCTVSGNSSDGNGRRHPR